MAEETGDPELELQGAGWTIIDLMELGDIDGVDIQIAAVSKLAEALHRPIWLWWASLFRGARAQLAGQFDEAERLAQETLAIGQRGQAENALHYYAQAMFNIRREQGRLAEVEGAVRGFIELYPAIPAWRGALALLLVELGRPEEARHGVRAGRRGRLRGLPARRQLADRDHADGRGLRRAGRCRRAPRELYGLLEPYAGRNVVVGRNATNNGSASRLLGILAAARGELECAERHFDDAQKMHAAMGAKPWHARTQVSYAELLLARRGAGDVERATEMLADAILVADALGMVVLAEKARRLVPSHARRRPWRRSRSVPRPRRVARRDAAAADAAQADRGLQPQPRAALDALQRGGGRGVEAGGVHQRLARLVAQQLEPASRAVAEAGALQDAAPAGAAGRRTRRAAVAANARVLVTVRDQRGQQAVDLRPRRRREAVDGACSGPSSSAAGRPSSVVHAISSGAPPRARTRRRRRRASSALDARQRVEADDGVEGRVGPREAPRGRADGEHGGRDRAGRRPCPGRRSARRRTRQPRPSRPQPTSSTPTAGSRSAATGA